MAKCRRPNDIRLTCDPSHTTDRQTFLIKGWLAEEEKDAKSQREREKGDNSSTAGREPRVLGPSMKPNHRQTEPTKIKSDKKTDRQNKATLETQCLTVTAVIISSFISKYQFIDDQTIRTLIAPNISLFLLIEFRQTKKIIHWPTKRTNEFFNSKTFSKVNNKKLFKQTSHSNGSNGSYGSNEEGHRRTWPVASSRCCLITWNKRLRVIRFFWAFFF